MTLYFSRWHYIFLDGNIFFQVTIYFSWLYYIFLDGNKFFWTAIYFSRWQYIVIFSPTEFETGLIWKTVGAFHTLRQPGEGGGVGLVQSKKFYCAFLSKFQTLKKFRKICNITSKIWGWGGWLDAYFYFWDKIENLVWQITRLFRIFFGETFPN